ncbi:MAG: hypothetical protein JWL84_4191 [Rhodospirillales bacterium]|jgi:hypothetical protein|nr:hypothetical protein [Rhodospirillales bacterium]
MLIHKQAPYGENFGAGVRGKVEPGGLRGPATNPVT